MAVKRKYKRVRNPVIRQAIVVGAGVLLILAIISLLPIRETVFLVIGFLIGAAVSVGVLIFLVILLISFVISVSYWARTGYWYSPWAMTPWGDGPGATDSYKDNYDERP